MQQLLNSIHSDQRPARSAWAKLGLGMLTLCLLVATLWGNLALYYQAPKPALWMAVWSLLALSCAVLLWVRGATQGVIAYLVLHGCLLVWWNTLEPSNEHIWADDLAQMTHGEVQGSRVTLHNVRNFNWKSETEYEPRWETRRYDLTQLQSVDMITSHWGMQSIAHVLVSFGFSDGQFVTFTVEIRKKQGQSFSEIGGFFKDFELSIMATDERDAISVRPNVRGEDSYLYRLEMPQELMQQLFLAYINQANDLVEQPRFYNTITANCTTIVFDMMRHITGRSLPLDPRLILTGYLPSYVQEQGGLVPDYPLPVLTERGRITERSKQAAEASNYSQKIRDGVPGWSQRLSQD